MLNLPPELQLMILDYLQPHDLKLLAVTSRVYHPIIKIRCNRLYRIDKDPNLIPKFKHGVRPSCKLANDGSVLCTKYVRLNTTQDFAPVHQF